MKVKKLFAVLVVSQMFLGINLAHGWTLKMDFNEGPLGVSADTDTGGGYPIFSDAAGHTLYSDCAGKVLDGQCAKMSIKKGHDGWGVWGGRISFKERGLTNLKKGDELWYSLKVYMPADFDYTSMPHLKFLRVHTKSVAQSNEGYNDLYITPDGPNHWDGKINSDAPYFVIKEFQGVRRLFGDFNTDRPKLGTWESYEVYLKLDNVTVKDGGTSMVRVWKNGKLMGQFNNIQTLLTKDSWAENLIVFGYWNGGEPDKSGAYPVKDQSLFIDDLTITTDTPLKKDSFGNPYIGDLVKMPNPPTDLIAVK